VLRHLRETALEYRKHAASAQALAEAAADQQAKRHYLDFARYWLDRALDYESAQFLGERI
jgi:hypothetical protein